MKDYEKWCSKNKELSKLSGGFFDCAKKVDLWEKKFSLAFDDDIK